MHKTFTLKNGLKVITVDLPHLNSVTTLLALGVGSRYETRRIQGLSHFLEHMTLKGSKKFPSTQEIAQLVDGIGAANNAATDREFTYYWIKSAARHIKVASDLLASTVKESLFKEDDIEREKGVILEEMRMYKDNPARLVGDLFEQLLFGDQPLGWPVLGEEETVKSLKRSDFLSYIDKWYRTENMTLVYAGKIPSNIKKIAQQYFSEFEAGQVSTTLPFKASPQTKPRVEISYKKTDQVHLMFGVRAYDRQEHKKYPAEVLAAVLGEGMSSRLFVEIRVKRGLAYHVSADYYPYKDTGAFVVYGGLKLEKIEEGLRVILEQIKDIISEGVMEEELKKAKEMIRGRLALRSESTNFLAEYFGLESILDHKIETFDEYLKNIDKVSAKDVQLVARELFDKSRFNLQIIGPFKSAKPFEKILES